MATRTSVGSGYWGTAGTWDTGVPANGDTVVIAAGHKVIFDVSQSGFANGLAGLTINGILHFSTYDATYLKMNGNITGSGRLYVAWFYESSRDDYSKLDGYDNVYYYLGSLTKIGSYEKTDGTPFTLVDSIEEVDSTPNSWYMEANDVSGWDFYVNAVDVSFNEIYEIERPAVGSEYRCMLYFNATGTINVPTIRMYGWYPTREYTTLSADANSEQATIVLTEDLGLQQGDIISLGSGSESGPTADSNNGLYTVQSYVAGTKTVTLTANLQHSRLFGDYIIRHSRPIKVSRSSGTNVLITTNGPIYFELTGVNFTTKFSTVVTSGYLLCDLENSKVSHCSNETSAVIHQGKNITFSDCTMGRAYLGNCSFARYVNCVSCNNNYVLFVSGKETIIENCIVQNSLYWSQYGDATYLNCLFKNVKFDFMNTSFLTFKECTFIESFVGTYATSYLSKNLLFKDCEFIGSNILHIGATCKFINCIFEMETPFSVDYAPNEYDVYLESFDHNQTPGNYQAWCKGGNITTENIRDRELKFTCTSALYPVYRNYKFNGHINHPILFEVPAEKDFSGGDVLIQIIDPYADPLIDDTEEPIEEDSINDVANVRDILTINFTPEKTGEYILRLYARNASGNVYFETKYVEQRSL